jgi:hypothetical protein
MKCSLEIDDSRAYWKLRGEVQPTAQKAFEDYWFGARSLSRVEGLLMNFRARYDAYPEALAVLHRWREMIPETRALICHWHVQLTDPLYRGFSGAYLVERRNGPRPEVTKDLVTKWVTEHGLEHWTVATRVQFASKLLSAAFTAGLVGSKRDPRPLPLPRVPDEALEYLLYLLRGVAIDGSLIDNSYLTSVGLEGQFVEERLASLPNLDYRRLGNVVDFGWRYADLHEWAIETVLEGEVLDDAS